MRSLTRQKQVIFLVALALVATPKWAAAQTGNSLNVDATGKVGIGTPAPQQKLHLVDSGMPTVRLEQTAGTVETWDFGLSSNASLFIKDVTNSSAVPFRIAAGAATSSLEIGANGKVGIGTDPATFPSPVLLTIKGSAPGDALIKVQNTAGGGYSGLQFHNSAGTPGFFFGVNNNDSSTRLNSFSNFPFLLFTNSVEHIRITPTGNIGINCNAPGSALVIASGGSCNAPWSSINPGSTQFTTSSSRSLKENLSAVQVPEILEKLSAVDVYRYDFIGGPKDKLGLMAEDFHKVFERGSDKVIDGQEVEMALWLAVRELAKRSDELHGTTSELADLRRENQELRERLRAIEERLATAPWASTLPAVKSP